MVRHLTLNQSIVGSSPTSTSNICNSSNGGPCTVLKTPGCRFESDGLHQNNKMIGYLYLITNNITGLQYVGKTYSSVEKRWKDHIKKSKTDIDRPLYRAISKYGPDNFVIEVIGAYEEGELEDKEIALIAELDTYKNGYNATLGGDGRRYSKYSDEELIALYNQIGNCKSIARTYHICAARLQKLLKDNSVPLNSNAHKEAMIKANLRTVYFVEHDIYFKDLTDCASYLIDQKLASASLKVVKSGIGRVLNGDRKSYLKLHFTVGGDKVSKRI